MTTDKLSLDDLEEIDKAFLDDLEAKAMAATPGPWGIDPGIPYHVWSNNHCEADCGPYRDFSHGMSQSVLNSVFISEANPKTVLKLIAEIRRLRGEK